MTRVLDKETFLAREFQSILRQNKVKKISLFGSYAEGTARESSDIDLLVEFDDTADLLDIVGLKLALEERLNKKVDIVTPESLSKYLRPTILRKAIPIYG